MPHALLSLYVYVLKKRLLKKHLQRNEYDSFRTDKKSAIYSQMPTARGYMAPFHKNSPVNQEINKSINRKMRVRR